MTPQSSPARAGVVGWCVPAAISIVTGMSPEKAWLEILADRHERGRRLLMLPGRLTAPHGGAHAAEALRVIRRAGFEAIDAWPGTRRMGTAEFLRFVARAEEGGETAGCWLVLQAMHLAAMDTRSAEATPDSRAALMPGLPIAKAWRIVRPMGPRS